MCFELEDMKIKLVEMRKKCRYHKGSYGKYNLYNIAPHGLCLEAFHSAYPFSLALLYDAEFSGNSAFISCPTGNIIMKIQRIQTLPKLVKTTKNLLEKFSENVLDFPVSRIDYKIKIEIINVNKCPKRYEKGETFWFNIKDKNELCPASFNSIFPYILSRNYPTLINCPDHEGMIYEVG